MNSLDPSNSNSLPAANSLPATANLPTAMQGQDPLAQLQDIHVPAEIGIWPPAWGWWLLAILIISTISVLVFLIRRNQSRNAYRKLALAELTKCEAGIDKSQSSEYLQTISILLRRTSISGFGEHFNLSLKGEDWLQWLDAQCKDSNSQFTQGVGRVLLTGPYQKSPEFNRTELHELVAQWIKKHRNQWQRKTTSAPAQVTPKEAAQHA